MRIFAAPSKKLQIMAHLTSAQRYTIYSMYAQGFSQKEIAKVIEKHKSVVSRELKRNRTKSGHCSYKYAETVIKERKERYRKKRKFTGEIENRINRYMRQEQWSPEQIVGYCKEHNYAMVSVERIYQYIRLDKKLGGDLYKFCRHQLKKRARPVGKRTPIPDRISIDQRPPDENGDKRGRWEMDLIVGPNNKDAMLTLTECSTNFIIINKLKNGKNADDVMEAAYRELLPYIGTIKSITTDNGGEFARHKELSKRLKTTIYFAHPYCSWEKGAIENANKLIRQYIPSGIPFSNYSELEIKEIQYKINRRPRKKLNYKSPKQIFFLTLQKSSCI